MSSLIDKGKVADKISDLFLDNYPNPSEELETFYKEVLKIVVNEEIQSWVSVKDRLPDKDGFYLAYYTFKDGGHACDMFYYNCGSPISSAITHWTYLPEPPKESDAE